MADDSKKVSAPYASFSSLMSFINKLRDTAIPSRIDPSVFGNASGTISYSVIAALKYLKLIDQAGIPSQIFKELVAADDAGRKPIFRQILRTGYPSLFDGEIDLKSVTAGQFDEHLREQYEVKGSTVDKVAVFFISAANFADEPISPHLKARKSVAASSTAKKSAKQRKQENIEPVVASPSSTPDHRHHNTNAKPLEYQLIDLMAEPDIEDEVKQSIWSLVQYLSKRKAKSAT